MQVPTSAKLGKNFTPDVEPLINDQSIEVQKCFEFVKNWKKKLDRTEVLTLNYLLFKF